MRASPGQYRSDSSIDSYYLDESGNSAIDQLSNDIALSNRSCIIQCRRTSRNIVALVPREGIIRNHRHNEPLFVLSMVA
jgi:hypothetical protein